MSDLEATHSRNATAAPILRSAQGAGRQLTTGGSAFSENLGILDAFADVFARMAVDVRPAGGVQGLSSIELDRPNKAGESSEPNQQESAEQPTDDESSDGVGVNLESAKAINEALSAELDSEAVSVQPAEPLENSPQSPDDSLDLETGQQDNDGVAPSLAQPIVDLNENPQDLQIATSESSAAGTGGKGSGNPGNGSPIGKTNGPGESSATASSIESTEVEASFDSLTDNPDGGESADDQSDRSERGNRRTKGHPSEGATPVTVEQPPKASANSGSEIPLENFDREAASSRPEPVASEPPPAVRRAAASAITGAVPFAAPNAAPGNPIQNATASGSPGNGFTTAITPSSLATTASRSKDPGPARDNASQAVTRAKLIQRVSKAFQHLGPDGGVIRLRLAPAEMGTVRLEMRIDAQRINARVVADSEAASALLREHLPDLRNRLESFGMQIDRFDIETESGDSNLGSRFDGNHRGDEGNDQAGNPFPRRFTPGSRRPVSPSVSPSVNGPTTGDVVLGNTGGVDLQL